MALRKVAMKRTQIKRRQFGEESVESKPFSFTNEARSTASDTGKSLWAEFLAGAQSASEQLGISPAAQENTLVEGQEISLKKSEEEIEEKPQASEGHLEYFRTVKSADILSENRVETEIRQRVEEIRIEIKNLSAKVKEVDRTVREASVDRTPVKPGKYHLSFFEFVLSTIKDATRKLEDSVSFGALFASRKQQRQHWTQNKKQGTQYGLSGERVVATQTG